MKEKIIKILNEYAIKYASLNNDIRPLEAKIILEEDFPAIAEKIEALDSWVSVEDDHKNLLSISKDVMNEVIRAKTMFPSNFVNQHEAYAVLLEEIDELWDEIKKNQKSYDFEAQRKEAIQASAMLFRFINELLPSKPKNI